MSKNSCVERWCDWLPKYCRRQTRKYLLIHGSCNLGTWLWKLTFKHREECSVVFPVRIILFSTSSRYVISGAHLSVRGWLLRLWKHNTLSGLLHFWSVWQWGIMSSYQSAILLVSMPHNTLRSCHKRVWKVRRWETGTLAILLGCCSSNLCGPTGWPNDDLRASRLSENSSNAEVFVSDSDYFSISSSPSALSTSTSATETLELPTSEARHRDRIPLGAWIPIGVKSLVFLIACALFLMMARKKHWFSRKGAVLQKNDTRPSSASDINNGGASQSASRDSAITRWATSRASHTNRSPMPFVELQPSPCDYGDIQLSIAPRSAARTVYQPYRPPTPLRELEGWRIVSVRSYLSSRIAGENHIVRGAALEWFSNSSRGPTLFSNEQ